jgi:hypothetical protein
MLVSLWRVHQSFETNNLSWSEIILRWRPFSQYQCSKNSTTRSSAVSVVLVGIIWMLEPSQSVMVRIQSWPSSRGNGMTKSMATLSPCSLGTGKGVMFLWVR